MSKKGFTLIELLVVIAIIGILAAMTAVFLPGVLERARLRATEQDLRSLGTALSVYAADKSNNSSYPPAYGYISFDLRMDPVKRRHLYPYMALIGKYADKELYDEWSVGHDLDKDGKITILEYTPVLPEITSGQYGAPPPLFNGNDPFADKEGPYVYIPVSQDQFNTLQKYYWKRWNDTKDRRYLYAEVWDGPLVNLRFPPPRYDSYVLISVGPKENSFGVVAKPLANTPIETAYHITAMRTYFLATRDANNDGYLDFDFRARTRNRQGVYPAPGLNLLPDGSNDAGPLIFKGAQ